MFIPTTKEEFTKLGWEKADIILITGDTYIDSPFIGSAVIGQVLIKAGYRVGIIAQPDIDSDKDISRLGEPMLFWGVTGGNVDSMVANYTALMKKRRSDDMTPGGLNNKRPDRAVIRYTNLIKKYFRNSAPVVLGGIEASLRRIAHYDYWSDSIRRSVLLDSKADILVYGMAEKTVLEMAAALKSRKEIKDIRGICYIADSVKDGYEILPSYEEVSSNKDAFSEMFMKFYVNNDPLTARGLVQKYAGRYLVHNPPQLNPSSEELNQYYEIDYTRDVHPYYKKFGDVKAQDTIKFSITTHRGCYGECSFCAIAVHQGRTVISRSEDSILGEAESFLGNSSFKGIITDAGGPTANIYGFECRKKIEKGACQDKSCVFPDTCKALKPNHKRQIDLLAGIRKIKGIKKVFVASGIRYDLIEGDKTCGDSYISCIAEHHVSGQLKIAPEHISPRVTSLMQKPSVKGLDSFKKKFEEYSLKAGKNQFLTYYLIAAHPGCSEKEMAELKSYTSDKLKINPEQVQIFTPTPSTISSLMYYTEKNPFSGKKIFVEKSLSAKQKQKDMLTEKVLQSPKKNYKGKRQYR